MKPKFTMLVGLPYSGKSTYVRQQVKIEAAQGNPWFTYSTDDVIEEIAHKYGFKYHECFKDLFDFAKRYNDRMLVHAVSCKTTIYWDQSNLTVASRRKKLEQIPSTYDKICIYWTPIADATLEARRAKRSEKLISPSVYETMKSTYVYPTLSEGFDVLIPMRDSG